MRRVLVLGVLLLCAAAVLLLFLQSDDSHAARRGPGTGTVPGEEASPAGPGAKEGGGDGAARATPGDDDPNRIPGPDLVLRGRVLRGEAGAEGATVAAARAFPAHEYAYFRWSIRDHEVPPPPIASATSGPGGAFELRIPRRTRVVLQATHPAGGYASLLLLVPETGDLPDLVLRLTAGADLTGVVVNEKDEPVAEASLALAPQDNSRPVFLFTAQGDEAGRFTIPGLPDGTYRLRAQAPGYPEARLYVSLPQQGTVRVRLRRAGVVTGKVTAGAGEPVAGARVYLSSTDAGQGGQTGSAEAETDATGTYRAEIAPGALTAAVVEHPHYGLHAAGRETFDLPTALLESGEELRYDIALRPGVPLRGRVVYGGTSAPAPGARLTLLKLQSAWRGMNEVAYATADGEGKFEFAYVTEGTYALDARAKDAARLASRYSQPNQPLTVDLYVDGETPPPEQRLELQPTGTVRGRILGVEPTTDANRRPGVWMQSPVGNLWSAADDLGAFELAHVPPMDEAVLQSQNPQVKSDPFRVEAGQVAEVILDPQGQAHFTGVVEDEQGRPVAGARVQVMAESQLPQTLQQFFNNSGWGTVPTDAGGRFRVALEGWMQGDYWRSQKFRVVAWRDGRTLALSPSQDYPEGDKTVELRLVLGSAGTVRGRVEFAGGGPAPHLQVNLYPKAEPGAPYETRPGLRGQTDFDGRFEIRGVGEGVYLASAYHPDGKVEGRDVRAGDTDVRLVIEPTSFIAGVVVTEDGSPVSPAQVAVIVPQERTETRRTGATAANGRFRVGQLPEGTYAVEVAPQTQGYGVTVMSFETKRVEGVATGTENLVIVVSEGPVLRGRVLDPRGRALAGAGVIAMALPGAGGPEGRRQTGAQAQQQRPAAITNGRGEFEIKGLGAGEVELIALSDGHAPATQKATAGGSPVTLRVVEGGVLEGSILKADGTPLANQWLNFQPTDRALQQKLQDWQQRSGQAWGYLGGWYSTAGQTDSQGRFKISSLLPGEYRLYLSLPDEILPPSSMRTGAGSVILRLEHALKIRGRVTDPEGRAIVLTGNNRVWINARQGEQWVRGAAADENGYFELTGIPRGTVTLQVWAGQEYKQLQVEVTAGANDVRLVLERK